MRDFYSFKAKEILGKRKVNKGDVILTSEPFAYVIDHTHRGQYCDNCIASSKNKTFHPCKECGFVYYCSSFCELEGSEVHSWECKALKRVRPYIPPNFARLLLRVIYKLKNGGDKYAEFYSENKSRKFKDLMNHYRDIKEDASRVKDVNEIYKSMKLLVGEQNLPYESDFIGVYGRALVNRFCLMDSNMCSIGSAIYLAGSIFDHSCIPNAYPCFTGKKLEIRSLIDIPQLDYNKTFISYLDVMKTTAQRRQELKENWYFWCECSLCTDENRTLMENCIKCDNPNCGIPILVPEKPPSKFMHAPVPHPQCTGCGSIVDEEVLQEYQIAVAFTRQRLKGMREENPSMEICLAIIEKQGNMFSPWNVWRVRALDFTFNAAYTNGVYGVAIEYGRNNFDAMKFYYGEDHPTFGLFLMKLGKSLLYLKEYKEGLKCVEDSERILKIAIGEKHPLVCDELSRLKIIANEDLEILLQRRMEEQEASQHELVCKHCGRRKNGVKQPPKNDDKIITHFDKNKKLVLDEATSEEDDFEYTTKPEETKWDTVSNGILHPDGTDKKTSLPYDICLDDTMKNYLTGTEGIKKNKYAMPETTRVWEKLLSESEIRWARYVAETEFNNEMAQLEIDSSTEEESQDEEIIASAIKAPEPITNGVKVKKQLIVNGKK